MTLLAAVCFTVHERSVLDEPNTAEAVYNVEGASRLGLP